MYAANSVSITISLSFAINFSGTASTVVGSVSQYPKVLTKIRSVYEVDKCK